MALNRCMQCLHHLPRSSFTPLFKGSRRDHSIVLAAVGQRRTAEQSQRYADLDWEPRDSEEHDKSIEPKRKVPRTRSKEPREKSSPAIRSREPKEKASSVQPLRNERVSQVYQETELGEEAFGSLETDKSMAPSSDTEFAGESQAESSQQPSAESVSYDFQLDFTEVDGGNADLDPTYVNRLLARNLRAAQVLAKGSRLSNIQQVILPPVPCKETTGYRNKIAFTVQADDGVLQNASTRKKLKDPLVIGLPGNKDVQESSMQDSMSNELMQHLREVLPQIQSKGRILFTRIVIRKGVNCDLGPDRGKAAYMLLLIGKIAPAATPMLGPDIIELYEPFVKELQEKFPLVKEISEARELLTKEKAYPRLTKLTGRGWLHMVVNNLAFRVPSLSFFHINTDQAGKLVDMVYKGAGLRARDTLTDLYSGVGLLGVSCLAMSEAAKQPLRKLQATDIYNFSSAAAKSNLKALGPKDVDLKKIKSSDLEQPTLGQSVRSHVVIADPPKAGLSNPAIYYLLRCEARTVVYVISDVHKQAKCLRDLCDINNKKAYRLQSLQAVDMCPETEQMLFVAVLYRNKVFDPKASEKNTYVKKAKGSPLTPGQRLLWSEDS